MMRDSPGKISSRRLRRRMLREDISPFRQFGFASLPAFGDDFANCIFKIVLVKDDADIME